MWQKKSNHLGKKKILPQLFQRGFSIWNDGILLEKIHISNHFLICTHSYWYFLLPLTLITFYKWLLFTWHEVLTFQVTFWQLGSKCPTIYNIVIVSNPIKFLIKSTMTFKIMMSFKIKPCNFTIPSKNIVEEYKLKGYSLHILHL